MKRFFTNAVLLILALQFQTTFAVPKAHVHASVIREVHLAAADFNAADVPATPSYLSEDGGEVINGRMQGVLSINADSQFAPRVQLVNPLHDEVMGINNMSVSKNTVATQHSSLAYLSRPDMLSMTLLVVLIVFIQSRVPVGRRIRARL